MQNVHCVICAIEKERNKGFIVYEDEYFFAFLDHKPLFLGHCLLAPKQHIITLYDLPTNLGEAWLTATQKLGRAVTKAMDSKGTFIANNNIVSQSIPHLHLHIVPRNKGDGLKGFFWPRTKYQGESQMEEVQLKIQRHIPNRF